MTIEFYYIKNGYVGNAVSWWGSESKGYVTSISEAGKFTKEEAENICSNRNADVAYLCSRIDNNSFAHKTIIDSQYIGSPDIEFTT